jgi:hypothetical protein
MDTAFIKLSLQQNGKMLIILIFCLISRFYMSAQDLEPRGYIRLPVNANILLPGFIYSHGKVFTDPNVPLKDFKANVEILNLAYGRTFSFFGLTAQTVIALPLCEAHASAQVNGQFTEVERRGTADMRARFSVLLMGGKAQTLREFVKQKKRTTILGTSITIQAPTGEYFPDKLVNLGTNRWSFKPEIALSEPLGNRWLLDLYAAVWLFTNNDAYFTGNELRSQNVIGSFQTHVSYNISPFAWAAFNATYYVGGQSSVNDKPNDDRLSNVRLGATLVLPTGKRSGLKLAFSKGAVVARGTDFTTFSLGWNYSWIKKSKQ